MKGIIYKYTFADGKIYIGQTRRHPEKRMREHFDKSVGPTNTGFWEAYNRLGAPEYSEIYQTEREDEDQLVAELNAVESFFIMLYRADNPTYGYNKKSFGNVGTKTNIIIRKAYDEYLSCLLKDRLKDYESAVNKIWNTKELLTPEETHIVRDKYRDWNTFQNYIDDYFKDPKLMEQDEIEFWLEEALGYVRFLIEQETEEDAERYIMANYTKILEDERSNNVILQIDKDGTIVKEYYSFNEICQAFNVPRADNVMNVLRGKQKSAYGFLWKYRKDLK